MPLVASALQASLTQLATHPGASVADCAQAWADAVRDYAATVVPPSTAVAAAGLTLASQLTSAFALRPSAASAMDVAFTAFAATLGAGMAPAFVAVPPPAPVGFASLFAKPFQATSAAAASHVATVLDTWMRTGTATPAAGGGPSPWA